MAARARKRLNVHDLLLPEDAEFLSQLAEDKGITRPELLRRIVDAEVERLRHVARSTPKEGQNGLAVATESPNREFGAKVRALEAIFERLRVMYRGEFDPLVGEAWSEFQRIVRDRDAAALDRFEKDRPWQLNTHPKAP